MEKKNKIKKEWSEKVRLKGHWGYCIVCNSPLKEGYSKSHKFCSNRCYGEYRKSLYPERNRICINCGKHFETNPAYIKRRKRAGIYCCRECFYEYKRKNSKITKNSGGYLILAKKQIHRKVMESHLGRKLKKMK